MIKPSDLRKAIDALLVSLHPRSFYQMARGNQVKPYVTWDLTSTDDGDMEVYMLEVDGWADAADNTALEAMMEAIDGDGDLTAPTGLHRRVLTIAGNPVGTIYRESRQPVPDDTDQIQRRRNTYQIRLIA